VIVTLALPTAVLAGCEGGELLDAAPGAQAVTSAAHATDKPVTAVNVLRRERVDGRSMAVPFSFVGSGMANGMRELRSAPPDGVGEATRAMRGPSG